MISFTINVTQSGAGFVARRGAHLAAERSPSAARADGARRSVAVPNGEGVASGSATI